MTELTIEEAGALAPLVTAVDGEARVAAGAVLIDVRSEAGRRAGGELSGAIVVGKDEVVAKLGVDSPDRIVDVDRQRRRSSLSAGRRGSGPVAAQLITWGYTDVVHVEGGFPPGKKPGSPPGLRQPMMSRLRSGFSQMSNAATKLLKFPNPVNEYAARSVAGWLWCSVSRP